MDENEAIALVSKLEAENERLKADNEALTTTMDACVEERLSEMNAEAEIFERECWVMLRTLCENRPGFDWKDYQDWITAEQAYEFLIEDYQEMENSLTRLSTQLTQSRAEGLREALDIMGRVGDADQMHAMEVRIAEIEKQSDPS